jgi:hypothetical protein
VNSAFAIKDVDTGEYQSRTAGADETWFNKDLAYVQLFGKKSTADLKMIKSTFIRWDNGYRTPRRLKVVELKITEVEE